SAARAAGRSARRINRSTSRVPRTASSSTRPTHSATALPPATAYGTPASSRALVALRNRSLTFSAAMSALSHPTGPTVPSAMFHTSSCCLKEDYSTAGLCGAAAVPHEQHQDRQSQQRPADDRHQRQGQPQPLARSRRVPVERTDDLQDARDFALFPI